MKKLNWTIFMLVASLMVFGYCIALAQPQQEDRVMRVTERGEDNKATRIELNIVNTDLPTLMKFLSAETNLTVIAAEEDIRDKKISLVNIKDVTVDEALEHVKSGLAQLGLTTIRTDNTIIITTIAKAVRMKVPVYVGKDPNEITPTDQVITQVMPLEYAAAAELSNAFKGMVSQNAVIFDDANTNSLVITDIASNIRRVAEVVSVIDRQPEEDIMVKIIKLNYADAQQLAQTLQQVFAFEGVVQNVIRRIRGRGEDAAHEFIKRTMSETGGAMDLLKGRIEISADVNTNSLIVKASKQNIEYVERFISQLDQSPTDNMKMKIFELKNANADDVATTLDELLGMGTRSAPQWDRWRIRMWSSERSRRGESGGTLGIVGEVRVTAESRLNAVIVVTDPRNFQIIENLVAELDKPTSQKDTKIYLIENADASSVVENLDTLISGGGGGSGDLPWWVRERRRGEGEQESGMSGIQGPVNMVADERLNAVIVATAPQNFPIIDDLIKQLDAEIPSQEWDTRIYPLKYADAENVAQIISSLYGSSSRNQSFFFFIPRRQRSTSGGSLTGNVSAYAYPTLNAVIVSTSPAKNFELIDKFIAQIDVPTPEDQVETTVIYQLEYSNADDLADLLNTMWESGMSRRSTAGRSSFFRMIMGDTLEQKDINTLAGQVDIVADSNTNSLMITTPKRNVDEVLRIIKQLDVSRGQVWLDIKILEVTLDNDMKFGLELALREKGAFGINKLTAGMDSSLQLQNEIIGFNYSLVTKEYQALIHTLMKENKVRTLAAPSIIVRDNMPATISIGKNIPYMERTSTSPITEAESTTFAYLENVGINIDITPHISKSTVSEGQKRTIGLEINQINTGDLLEYTTFNAPVTSSTTFSTYVDVEDGQQIVIGGMIKQKTQKTVHQVPILGSIPVIGRLFKKTADVSENTEIIVMITPHIFNIKDVHDNEMIKKKQSEIYGQLKEETELLDNSKSKDN